jgi:hypothetical protein
MRIETVHLFIHVGALQDVNNFFLQPNRVSLHVERVKPL